MSLSHTPTVFDPSQWFSRLTLPAKDSHKGQNGKLLIIGGSGLFHSASKWSLDVASKFVDMLFYASTPENNALVQAAKGSFWNGIVIEASKIVTYAQEADVILIGPGMERTPETAELTNFLLQRFPEKKWVVDAGALQMADPTFFTAKTIITPHKQELLRLAQKLNLPGLNDTLSTEEIVATLAEKLPCTIICKGETDLVINPADAKVWQISGGNPGMTKGGTGDVLAGLIAALYCTHDALVATLIGGFSNKAAGDLLAEKVGPFYNASDLVEAIPTALWNSYSRYSTTSGK
jgi:NAD(P)H-hydrate epimerase